MTTDQEKRATLSGTYPTPEHGWVCFHCGEHFSGTYEGQKRAKAHFGTNPESKTLCLVHAAYGLAKWQRYLEDKNKELERANIQLREQLAIAQAELLTVPIRCVNCNEPYDVTKEVQTLCKTFGSSHIYRAHSRTALDEEIRKARKQALEDAANDCDEWATAVKNVGTSKHREEEILGYKNAAASIRDMANSLTPTSQQSTEPSE